MSDQVQIYLRDGQGARGTGGESASQAVLMAELQTVRHLLHDASAAMAEVSQERAQLEEELSGALDELRSAKQSWQASEMSLRVQTEGGLGFEAGARMPRIHIRICSRLHSVSLPW